MNMLNQKFLRASAVTLLVLLLSGCGDGGLFGKIAVPLIAEECVDCPAGGQDEGTVHDLFGAAPGTRVPMARYSSAVDPVGTGLTNDFDGDGIANEKETTGNVWVADYPVIETTIVTPVSMSIEILHSGTTESESFGSEITSDDTSRNMDTSMEAAHRNELNTRTIDYMNTKTESDKSSFSIKASVKAEAGLLGTGTSAKASTSYKNTSSDTNVTNRVKWADVPFKNNLKRDAWELKRDESSKKARQLRSEIRTKNMETNEVKPNAGSVRASLYINNLSVNMPVKMKNILCSLIFETAEGKVLPVQSFRLRNQDYSLFEIDLYGDSTFGPYVIELSGLNTNEVRSAINRGYTPRIFIIDYTMEHVRDSNYRSALSSSFTGDNLKIVEENAKGRTAGIRIVGPEIREFFRVAAFMPQKELTERINTRSSELTEISPGVALERALNRISFSGHEIEYANYVLDIEDLNMLLTDSVRMADGSPYPGHRIFFRGIRSINGIETSLPVFSSSEVSAPDIDGYKTYVVKPSSLWTEADIADVRVWVVFDRGRYYAPMEIERDEAGQPMSPYIFSIDGVETAVPRMQGLKSTVWPGDHYDITCLDLGEFLNSRQEFGHNPLETGSDLFFNSRWNLGQLGEYPFYAETGSTYLGEAGPGDTVEFSIKLNNTYFLNPSFGEAAPVNGGSQYSGFSYLRKRSTRKFTLDEAVDFEISFGLGGRYTDWVNIRGDANDETDSRFLRFSSYTVGVSTSWDFVNQIFRVKMTLPREIEGIDPDGVVNIYFRPALSAETRETVWPLSISDVKKFRGILSRGAAKGMKNISVKYPSCQPLAGDTLVMAGDAGETSYSIDKVSCSGDGLLCDIALTGELMENHPANEAVYVNLRYPHIGNSLSLYVPDNFYWNWNYETAGFLNYSYINSAPKVPLYPGSTAVAMSGFSVQPEAANWAGYRNFSKADVNSWADAGLYSGYVKGSLVPSGGTPVGLASRMQFSTGYYAGAASDSRVNELSFRSNVPSYPAHGYPGIAGNGEKAVIVWQAQLYGDDWDIRGRIIDLETGAVCGREFSVSVNNNGDQKNPSVVMSGSKAVVVWQSDDSGDLDIRGRIIDINSGPVGSSDFRVNTLTAAAQQNPQISIDGNRAFVVWESHTGTNGLDIRGRVIDTEQGNPAGNEIAVSFANAGVQQNPRTAVSGSVAFTVWESYDTPAQYSDIRGRAVNLTTGASVPAGSDLLINSVRTNYQQNPELVFNGARAFAVWHSNHTGVNDYRIMGRAVDVSSAAIVPVTAVDTAISIENEGSQQFPKIAYYGTKAFAVWNSSNKIYDSINDVSIRGRIIDLQAAGVTGSDLLLSQTTSIENYNPSAVVTASKVFILWDQWIPDGEIKGCVVNLNDGMISRDEFDAASSIYDYNQWMPRVIAYGTRAYAVWFSAESGSQCNIRGRLFGEALYGGLNRFFTAPIVERDYTVKAVVVE
jgi:hypothetical protein